MQAEGAVMVTLERLQPVFHMTVGELQDRYAEVFGEAHGERDDGEHGGPAERFGKDARVAHVEPGDLFPMVPEVTGTLGARYRAGAFGLEVVPLPSPGRVEEASELIPASYMNFYVGNAAVVVPIWGAANDEAAVELIGALFPGRRAVGLPARRLVAVGGGAFHCISREVPA